jgi:hypothetical protein
MQAVCRRMRRFELVLKTKSQNSKHIADNVLSWAYPRYHFQADLIWADGTFKRTMIITYAGYTA